jgi:hypothetical protein
MRLLTTIILVGVGCGGVNMKTQLRTRAAFDFGCPAEKLTLTELDNPGWSADSGLIGVDGCGKRATYVSDRGTWIMNTASGKAEAAPTTAQEGTTQ